MDFGAPSDPVRALDGVDLDIQTSRMTAVLGPSGCGKTTLLRVLGGFLHPSGGTITLDGAPLVSERTFVKAERRGIGFVAQEGALFPHLSVASNIGFGLTSGSRATATMTRRERRRRIDEVLDLVGLAGLGRRRPDELSGGQQQRVALARALAPKPKVILLDEPFSAVDASMRLDLGLQVSRLLHDLATTSVMVTHDQSEALSLADQVAVMRNGRVVQSGPPATIYRHPADPETASFVGAAVLLPGHMSDETHVECELGRLPVDGDRGAMTELAGQRCTVMLRPEQLRLGSNGVTGMVTDRQFYGHDATVSLTLDGSDERIIVRTDGSHVPMVTQRVSVTVDGSARVFPGS